MATQARLVASPVSSRSRSPSALSLSNGSTLSSASSLLRRPLALAPRPAPAVPAAARSLFASSLRHPAFHHATAHPKVQQLAGRALDGQKLRALRMLSVCPADLRDAFALKLAYDIEAAHGRPQHTGNVRRVLDRLLAGATGEALPALCSNVRDQVDLMHAALPYLALGELTGPSAAYLQLHQPPHNDAHPGRPGSLSPLHREVLAQQANRTHALMMKHQLATSEIRRVLQPPRRFAVLPREPAAQLVALASRLVYDQVRGHPLAKTRRRVASIPDAELGCALKAAVLTDLANDAVLRNLVPVSRRP